MFILEQQELSEAEAMMLIMESPDGTNILKEEILDPMYEKLSDVKVRNQYIALGDEFLAANADMLAKEYPTAPVSFPRLYVNRVFDLFGFKQAQFLRVIKEALKEVDATKDFKHITASPTNIIHIITMNYSDMIHHVKLRDSARQQLALTAYGLIYNKYFASAMNEALMAYTYSQLNQTWHIVRDENVITWIGGLVDTVYENHRSKIDLDMGIKTIVIVLNGIRNNFNQAMQLLANKYHEYKEQGVQVGDDVNGTEDYIDTNSYSNIRNGLMLLIKNGDNLYWSKSDLYKGMARLKNIEMDSLYNFATKKVKMGDISMIMDLIFYVFLSKEGNTIAEINSAKYIKRITNFPTAVDRCIQGKPVVAPLVKKYNENEEIIRTFICLVATYILNRINDVNQS